MPTFLLRPQHRAKLVGNCRGLGFPEPMGVRVELGPPGALGTERIRQLPGIRAGSGKPEQCAGAGLVCRARVTGGTGLSWLCPRRGLGAELSPGASSLQVAKSRGQWGVSCLLLSVGIFLSLWPSPHSEQGPWVLRKQQKLPQYGLQMLRKGG